MRIVFLGAPGSGKGTQARLLSERLHVPAISTGDMLRAAVREETPLGRRAKEVMERGELVSDEIMTGLIRERISRPDALEGFVLDGFPRTPEQAAALEALLSGNGKALTAVIHLLVPEDLLVERMLGRAADESRADDKPEAIAERLRVYREKTEPLIGFYRDRGLLAEVNGVGEVREVAEWIDGALPVASGPGRAATGSESGGPSSPPGAPRPRARGAA